jgi:lipopolysaccharide biosynthesis glycosyltransferase
MVCAIPFPEIVRQAIGTLRFKILVFHFHATRRQWKKPIKNKESAMVVFPNETSGSNALAAKPTFHVAFCIDNRYFRSMGATIMSLIAHNPDIHFVFHIFAFAVSDTHRRKLSELESRFKVGTHVHLIDPAIFKEFAHFTESSYYSPSIFTRLLIPAVLQGTVDRVLYLDADILCVGRVDELVELDIRDTVAVVVPDAEATTARRTVALNLKQPKYFNSGVMYMNVDLWMANRITESTIDAILKDGKNFRFPDQDALNVVLDGRAIFIDKKWNYLYGLIGDLDADKRKMNIVGDAVFIHFAGAVKPWNNWSGHESRELFLKYHAISPWSDMPLDDKPQNYKEMRMFSRFLFKRSQFVDSAAWYLRYLSKKMFSK